MRRQGLPIKGSMQPDTGKAGDHARTTGSHLPLFRLLLPGLPLSWNAKGTCATWLGGIRASRMMTPV
jgi:hypothetical protein